MTGVSDSSLVDVETARSRVRGLSALGRVVRTDVRLPAMAVQVTDRPLSGVAVEGADGM